MVAPMNSIINYSIREKERGDSETTVTVRNNYLREQECCHRDNPTINHWMERERMVTAMMARASKRRRRDNANGESVKTTTMAMA